jgi:hypothetical protein
MSGGANSFAKTRSFEREDPFFLLKTETGSMLFADLPFLVRNKAQIASA